MTKAPLVSVLMTVYNREAYIEEAIHSVINATYKNLELIIVDDQSTDGSMNIAEKIAKTDGRIKIYYNSKNLGDYPNRNKAASYAKGRYIKYVDSDDYIFPNWFDVMVAAMEKYPEAGIGINKFVRNSNNPGPFYYSSKEAYHVHFFQRQLFNASPLSVIMKRDIFEKLGGFSDLRYSGDFDMWMRMAALSGVIIAEHPLAEWREHGEQEKKKGEDHYLFMGRKIEKKYLMGNSCPLNAGEIKLALHLITISHALRVFKFLIHLKIKTALRLVKNYELTPGDMMMVLWSRIFMGKRFYHKIQNQASK